MTNFTFPQGALYLPTPGHRFGLWLVNAVVDVPESKKELGIELESTPGIVNHHPFQSRL